MRSGERRLLKVDPVLGGFDSQRYVTEYLRAPARDGADVPVALVYRRGLALDGKAPLLQYGYGAYGLSSDPTFLSSLVSLLDRGFVYAIAQIRGGQELGRRWYDTGRLLAKRNSFTDFIDVTEFLVARGYADPQRVFARGGSAGGLLMGAVINMAPQLYRGIVAHVPFVDVVTTMLDATLPLTTNEYDEWGNPNEKPFYDYMLTYSPYDNVRAQAYPALLRDDRSVGQPGAVFRAGQVGRATCGVSRPIRTPCCSRSTWKPGTAASPVASSITASSPRNTHF